MLEAPPENRFLRHAVLCDVHHHCSMDKATGLGRRGRIDLSKPPEWFTEADRAALAVRIKLQSESISAPLAGCSTGHNQRGSMELAAPHATARGVSGDEQCR
jgi:hypothetical protein